MIREATRRIERIERLVMAEPPEGPGLRTVFSTEVPKDAQAYFGITVAVHPSLDPRKRRALAALAAEEQALRRRRSQILNTSDVE